MLMYLFTILKGTFVKKLVFIYVCVCTWWKFTQNFANTVDNVGNILKQQNLFMCTLYVLFFFVKSDIMNDHITLQIVCF